jgi:hypothetical protein
LSIHEAKGRNKRHPNRKKGWSKTIVISWWCGLMDRQPFMSHTHTQNLLELTNTFNRVAALKNQYTKVSGIFLSIQIANLQENNPI